MPSQKMRLEAEMRDNASPAIRKLRQELADLQAQTSETRGIAKLNKEIAQLRKESGEFRSTAGMKAFTGWMAEAKTAATGVMGAIGGVAEVLGPIGIGAIGAGAAVSTLASEIKKLGKDAIDLKELSRQTGMSREFVNAWSHAAEHFGVAEDAAKGMLGAFAAQLPQFRIGLGSMYQEFAGFGASVSDVQKDIEEHNPAKALMDALRQADEIGRRLGPQVRKQFLESMGLGAEGERLMAAGVSGLRDQINKPWATPSQELATQAQKFRDATIGFNNQLQRFENTVGPGFLTGLTAIVNEAEDFLRVWERWETGKKDPDGPKSLGTAAADALKPTGIDRWIWDAAKSTIEAIHGKDYLAGSREALKPHHLPPDMRALKDALQDKARELSTSPHGGLLHKSSYDGPGFGGLLQNASYVTGGTGSGTMTGAVSEGARTGVLQAFREAMLEQDLKGGMGLGSGGDAGGGGAGGRRGFMQRGSGGNGLAPDTGAFPAGSSLEEVRQYIRAKASALGIDPNIAERVARSEGLNKSLGAGGDGGTSDGPFQLHIGGGLGDIYERKYHHSIHDKRYWRDQVDFALGQARQGGWAPWHGWRGAPNAGIGIRPDSTALDALRKRGVGDPETANGGASYPGHIGGRLSIEGENYRFGSGGVRGSASIPLGDYPITPGAVGAWGQANGALGINGNKIWDKTLGRMRAGIEMHAGHSADLITEGCLAFEQSQFPKLKAHVLDMIRRKGHAYLHVGQDGASITSDRRATGLNDAARDRDSASHHKVTVGVEVTGHGRHKSTKIERNGPLPIEAENPWQTGVTPLLEG